MGTGIRSGMIGGNFYRSKSFYRGVEKQLKILLVHDNRTGYHTTKAHKFADKLKKNPYFQVIIDKDIWQRNERTSQTEIDRREREMVRKSDLVLRIVPAPSKTGQKRHDGSQREIRKAIFNKKPIIEIFEQGARNSPNRSIVERNYRKKEEIHLKPGEQLKKGFNQALHRIKQKGLI
ncbi:MAG: hypothetical protein ACTSSI_17250 [Candidatus Helarchaeota archaeon]